MLSMPQPFVKHPYPVGRGRKHSVFSPSDTVILRLIRGSTQRWLAYVPETKHTDSVTLTTLLSDQ
jgi:hypothetical protein